MGLILHIDTSAGVAAVSLAEKGRVLHYVENKQVNEHAAFIQPAIKDLAAAAKVSLAELDAVAVANGPGSYTGLRVGLASAKGICYALSKPLITIGTLPLMAHAAALKEQRDDILYAPMIDARRMEVFTGLYNSVGNEEMPPIAKILTNDFLVAKLLQSKILFFGTGAAKFEKICEHGNALFSGDYSMIDALAQLAYEAYKAHRFADLAYVEPLYLKEFYTGR
ncbi:MAG: tRNA (adenosine(37)-N6)-threonylcarbamoyltransferase complex dimerization subunit type 1 TsaB [Chitinophagaceae bacterium]|nr:MAG: tRNA (adenosine(37)-N6)-threonylcarbamoyltransferase complex dimerization subunit type 1 TsaB [Chitinophagaceae bacterium]